MWEMDMSTTAGDDDQRERAADEGSGEEGEDGIVQFGDTVIVLRDREF